MKKKRKSPKDAPLAVKVTRDQLIISIGINTLAWASQPENGGKMQTMRVRKGAEREWAKDIANEMEREDGDYEAQSRLSNWLDEMEEYASERGSGALTQNNESQPARD